MHPLRRDDVKIQIECQEKRPGDTSSVVRSKASRSARESKTSHQTRQLLEGSSNGTVSVALLFSLVLIVTRKRFTDPSTSAIQAAAVFAAHERAIQ